MQSRGAGPPAAHLGDAEERVKQVSVLDYRRLYHSRC